MKQKGLALFTAVATAAVTFSPVMAMSPSFPDVPEGYGYKYHIDYVVNNGLASGFTDGTFKPVNEITRAEFTKILINSAYSQDIINECMNSMIAGDMMSEGETIFPDVEEGNVFKDYICVAKMQDIITGFSDLTFKPENPITFGEASKIAVRTLDSDSGITADALLTEYLSLLETNSALPPTLNTGLIDQNINRAEAAYLIQIVRDNYVGLPVDGEAIYDLESMSVQGMTTLNIPPGGIQVQSTFGSDYQVDGQPITIARKTNHGIHCTTQGIFFVETTITVDGESKAVRLESNCSGGFNQTASINGVQFAILDWSKGANNPSHDPNLFEYTIDMFIM